MGIEGSRAETNKVKSSNEMTFVEMSKASLVYRTDKFGVPTDWGPGHSYSMIYDSIMNRLRLWDDWKEPELKDVCPKSRAVPLTIVEIGDYTGGFVRLCHDFFSDSQVIGIDVMDCWQSPPPVSYPRFRHVTANGYDIGTWRLLRECGIVPDIIIDDGSHSIVDQIFVLEYLPEYLSETGIILIEDVQQRFRKYLKIPGVVMYEYDNEGMTDDAILIYH